MWCSEPLATWNISPAATVKDEEALPSSSTETSTLPERQ
jgi:hypothetical protein